MGSIRLCTLETICKEAVVACLEVEVEIVNSSGQFDRYYVSNCRYCTSKSKRKRLTNNQYAVGLINMDKNKYCTLEESKKQINWSKKQINWKNE